MTADEVSDRIQAGEMTGATSVDRPLAASTFSPLLTASDGWADVPDGGQG